MIQLALEGQHGRAEAVEHGPACAPAATELGEGSTVWSCSGHSRRGQDPMLVPALQDGDKTMGVRQASSHAPPRVLPPVPSICGCPCACPVSPRAHPHHAAVGRTRALTSTNNSPSPASWPGLSFIIYFSVCPPPENASNGIN